MVEVKCIQVIQGNPVKFIVEDKNGNKLRVTNADFVESIKLGRVSCSNVAIINNKIVLTNKVNEESSINSKDIKYINPSIFGVYVNSIRDIKDRHGHHMEGTVNYKGNKLGYWSQDPNNVLVDYFDFDRDLLGEALMNYREYRYDFDIKLEKLVHDAATLTKHYQIFKNNMKNGLLKTLIVTDIYDYNIFSIGFNEMTLEEERFLEDRQRVFIQNGITPIIKEYTSDYDFIIPASKDRS